MSNALSHLQAIVFDWAGTTIDHGSRAPAIVFQRVFAKHGVEITIENAREPMGMAKREHIAAIGAIASVAESWQSAHGRPFNDDDVSIMYEEFLPLQMETLHEHCELIEGAAETVNECRRLGLKIGSSTGYTHELMKVVSAAAKEQGYEPDCVLCAEDAPRGRPAPYLLHEAAKRMDVFPMWSIVKVDDTAVGVEAGRNAGCWTIGVTLTGNSIGLSAAEIDALSPEEQTQLHENASQKLVAAGAHTTVPSVADILPLLHDFNRRASIGNLPMTV